MVHKENLTCQASRSQVSIFTVMAGSFLFCVFVGFMSLGTKLHNMNLVVVWFWQVLNVFCIILRKKAERNYLNQIKGISLEPQFFTLKNYVEKYFLIFNFILQWVKSLDGFMKI